VCVFNHFAFLRSAMRSAGFEKRIFQICT